MKLGGLLKLLLQHSDCGLAEGDPVTCTVDCRSLRLAGWTPHLGLPIWCLEKVLWKCHDLCSSFAKANMEMFEGPFTQWFDGNKALATEVWEKITFLPVR